MLERLEAATKVVNEAAERAGLPLTRVRVENGHRGPKVVIYREGHEPEKRAPDQKT